MGVGKILFFCYSLRKVFVKVYVTIRIVHKIRYSSLGHRIGIPLNVPSWGFPAKSFCKNSKSAEKCNTTKIRIGFQPGTYHLSIG